MKLTRTLGVVALTAVVGVAAGCGESKVVSTNNGSFGGQQGGSQAGGPSGGPTGDLRQRFAKFRSCLKSHGVNLPTPQAGNSGPPQGFDPRSPNTRKALQACKSILAIPGNGAPPTGGPPGGGPPGGGPPGGAFPGGGMPPQ